MNKPLISVIVCTHNRANLLKQCLKTLVDQTLISELYEVLIIDNNSSDNTREVVNKFTKEHSHFIYLMETKQGLSHARNRGFQAAKAGYVAYTDDDCKIPKHWLSIAKDIIDNVNPAVFGGPALPFYNTPKPFWFKDSYGSDAQWGDDPRPLKKRFVHGMNIFFRKSILHNLNGFNPNMGMIGKTLAYGEESELIQSIRTTWPNEIIYYHPDLYVYHLVRSEKMSVVRFARERFYKGKYLYYVFDNNPGTSRGRVLQQVISMILSFSRDVIIQGLLKRDRKTYPYLQNYLYEIAIDHYLFHLGRLYEKFRQT
ncbi:MAG: glycosyltransferase [Candidatus Scalinduaceae bacterium]